MTTRPDGRAYAAPRLTRFGSLATWTKRVGVTSTLRDKFGAGNNKTR
ncbi:MAG: hypothetical protein HY084_09665 [Gemmatimonadetes bacterium]|nr:hypothetical protein [Gemmatimonadota bacterium]